MSEERELELYRTFRAAQERYTYFMLAASGAAIAFAVTKTQDATLAWSQIPLAISITCWGLSFYCGCNNLRYVGSTLYANFEMLKIQTGQHPQVGNHPQMIDAASSGIRSAIETNSNRASMYARLQFSLLIIGAVSYVGWHTYEMYLRTKP